MDKPEQDGIWDGEGPQATAAPSPTFTCKFEQSPEQCTFPDCLCGTGEQPHGYGAPVELARPAKPKRYRAKYMREYRARTKAARTQ